MYSVLRIAGIRHGLSAIKFRHLTLLSPMRDHTRFVHVNEVRVISDENIHRVSLSVFCLLRTVFRTQTWTRRSTESTRVRRRPEVPGITRTVRSIPGNDYAVSNVSLRLIAWITVRFAIHCHSGQTLNRGVPCIIDSHVVSIPCDPGATWDSAYFRSLVRSTPTPASPH